MTIHQHPDPVSPTLHALLQRGHGRGALRATPQDAELVFDCVAHDRRIDWQVEQRAVYFARLIRDLGLPVRPVAEMLYAHDSVDAPDVVGVGVGADDKTAQVSYDSDDFAAFCLALDVLSALGSGGSAEAVRALRDFVHSGERWVEALEDIAADWPRELWDDLADVARARAREIGPGGVCGTVSPWREWRAEHPWVDELLRAIGRPDAAAHPAETAAASPPLGPAQARVTLPPLDPDGDESDSDHTTRLRGLWLTVPHSPARAHVLRSLLARHGNERPDWLAEFVHESLWDSEDEVRLLGVRHANLDTPGTRTRVAALADDPVEDEPVRAAARRRLGR
ncbi:hypothetical protein LO772_06720 [Yinghuangia sp. ASG 101]|uniref:hypothetical protein n=1 Tax=Yinghuangia sp. ASG 101 TaxID=2896848 RepID=UPI001E4ED167|nr:hypothetical protein [Yinghuangia sp. ASG 101]UGQ13302.1 hypothetical protein LO772_06720 [Yinghuangia sp. ASG 101]